MQVGQPFNPQNFLSYVVIPSIVCKSPKLTPFQKLLYGVLFAFRDQRGGTTLDQVRMAAELGVSVQYVRKGLKALTAVRMIKVISPTGEDRLQHKHNRYVFTTEGL